MFKEVFMKLPFRTVHALLVIGFTFCVQAQDGKHDSTSGGSAETHRSALTGKEKLGPKWTDEQRIDNCHVPIDKRGNKPRPSACPNSPSS